MPTAKFDRQHVNLSKAPTGGAFAESSDGRTVDPPYHSDEVGSEGKTGKPRARKPRKKSESLEDE
jgi:hypothetical protein